MKKSLPLILLLAGLAACASAPKIDYFTLGTGGAAFSAPGVNVVVQRFQTTEALARPGIMVALSDTRVAYRGTAQWAEGLGGMVQQRLAAFFGPPTEGLRTVTLSGTVLACEEVLGPSGRFARVKLDVVIRDAAKPRYKPPLLVRTYEAERPVPSGEDVGPVVEALAWDVDEIARKIAADLQKLSTAEPHS